MATACPACTRPNGDSATKCLYCSEPRSPGVPGGVLFDNEAQFRFYARWRYRLERHLSPLNRASRGNK